MIHYYCGYPRCGKSEWAEDGLRKVQGRVLYVGTLPTIQIYHAIILRHKQRRPNTWALYECVGNPRLDIPRLDALAPSFDGIIIDGLSYYLRRAIYYYPPDTEWLFAFRGFMDKAVTLPVELYLVDQPVDRAPPEIQRICRLLHEELYRYSEDMFYIEDGTANEVNADDLRKRDGINDV